MMKVIELDFKMIFLLKSVMYIELDMRILNYKINLYKMTSF